VRTSSYEFAEIESDTIERLTHEKSEALDLFYQGRKVATSVKYATDNGVVIEIFGTRLESPMQKAMTHLGTILCNDVNNESNFLGSHIQRIGEAFGRKPLQKGTSETLGVNTGEVKCYKVKTGALKSSHLLVQYKGFGVTHQNWYVFFFLQYQMIIATRFARSETGKLRLEMKGSLAWSPFGEWLSPWGARSADHLSGSWYVHSAFRSRTH